MTRFVVYGAGGVGGVMAARLHQSGHDVVAIARGAHLDAWRAQGGLRVQDPDRDEVVDVPVVGHPGDAAITSDDIVILTMKGQHTSGALDDLAETAPADIPIVCAQNGVANEREALRRYERVYGMCVMFPAAFVEPGVVQAQSSPVAGILDVGRYPGGIDDVADAVAAALSRSTFVSEPTSDVMRWKHTKLLMNLGNSIQAVVAPGGTAPLYEMVRREGEAVLRAGGIPFASQEEDAARRGDILQTKPIGGATRGGGSTWQSLARGTGSVEADLLNGEIVLLGRLMGVSTPANALFQRLAKEAARERKAPGHLTADEALSLLV